MAAPRRLPALAARQDAVVTARATPSSPLNARSTSHVDVIRCTRADLHHPSRLVAVVEAALRGGPADKGLRVDPPQRW